MIRMLLLITKLKELGFKGEFTSSMRGDKQDKKVFDNVTTTMAEEFVE